MRIEIKSGKRYSSRHVQLTLMLHFNHKNNSFQNFIAVLCHRRNSVMQFRNIHAFFLDQNPTINDHFPINLYNQSNFPADYHIYSMGIETKATSN